MKTILTLKLGRFQRKNNCEQCQLLWFDSWWDHQVMAKAFFPRQPVILSRCMVKGSDFLNVCKIHQLWAKLGGSLGLLHPYFVRLVPWVLEIHRYLIIIHICQLQLTPILEVVYKHPCLCFQEKSWVQTLPPTLGQDEKLRTYNPMEALVGTELSDESVRTV